MSQFCIPTQISLDIWFSETEVITNGVKTTETRYDFCSESTDRSCFAKISIVKVELWLQCLPRVHHSLDL